jgi:Ca2+-binding RTX toxin-like protein
MASPSHRIEQIRFGDGSLLSHAELLERFWIGGTSAGNDYLIGHHDAGNRIDGLDGDDYLVGGVLNDVLRGSNGHDQLLGRAGDDLLEGGAGNDRLNGESGRDTLAGGAGDDWLEGGEGDDLYRFSRGDGHDQINDIDDKPSNLDTVQWLDLNPSDLNGVLRNGHDLQLTFRSGDRLSVCQYFASSSNRVEQFRFADGSRWSHAELLERLTLAGATAGHDTLSGYNDISNRIDGLDGDDYLAGGVLNDVLRGSNGHDHILGRAGDDLLEGGAGNDQLKGDSGHDSLNGGAGNDWLVGGEGDDQLSGDAGNDTLVGGSGRDLLIGGVGADIYQLSRGDGQDRLRDVDTSPATVDEVLFNDQGSNQVTGVLRMLSNLQLTMASGDSLTVLDYFAAISNRIEQFRFADGQVWSHGQLLDRLRVGGATAGNDNLGGYNDTPNHIDGLDGHDVLIGGALNDSLRGNNGSDNLQGRAGDDLLEGGFGDDNLLGEAGIDTLTGGPGNDLLDGGVGADVYRMARGDGQDRIRDVDSSTANIDQVQFSDLSTSQVSGVLRRSNDLQLSFGSGDSLTVLGYFSSNANRIEQFRFADTRTWTHTDLIARLTVLT